MNVFFHTNHGTLFHYINRVKLQQVASTQYAFSWCKTKTYLICQSKTSNLTLDEHSNVKETSKRKVNNFLLITFIKNGMTSLIYEYLPYLTSWGSYHSGIPVDTGRKLNVHKTFKTSSEGLMYVQFTSCVYED